MSKGLKACIARRVIFTLTRGGLSGALSSHMPMLITRVPGMGTIWQLQLRKACCDLDWARALRCKPSSMVKWSSTTAWPCRCIPPVMYWAPRKSACSTVGRPGLPAAITRLRPTLPVCHLRLFAATCSLPSPHLACRSTAGDLMPKSLPRSMPGGQATRQLAEPACSCATALARRSVF